MQMTPCLGSTGPGAGGPLAQQQNGLCVAAGDRLRKGDIIQFEALSGPKSTSGGSFVSGGDNSSDDLSVYR